MTVTEQREQVIRDLATILEWQRNHDVVALERRDDENNDHIEILNLLKAQNGRVRINTAKINWIMGVGTGIAFILGVGHFIL